MDIVQLIEELEDLLDEASAVPFSSKVMVDPEEMNSVLSEMRNSLPEEIKQANWVNEEKDNILSSATKEAEEQKEEAQKEVDRLTKEANRRYEELINEHEITKEATKQGQDIVNRAESNAREIQEKTLEYVDEMLVHTQDELRRLLDILEENREELKN